jgi:hypothetical protein
VLQVRVEALEHIVLGLKHDDALGRLLEVMRERLYGHSHSKIDEHSPGIPQGRHLSLLAYADIVHIDINALKVNVPPVLKQQLRP